MYQAPCHVPVQQYDVLFFALDKAFLFWQHLLAGPAQGPEGDWQRFGNSADFWILREELLQLVPRDEILRPVLPRSDMNALYVNLE